MEVLHSDNGLTRLDLGFDTPAILDHDNLITPLDGLLVIRDGRHARSCWIDAGEHTKTNSPWVVGIGDGTYLLMGSNYKIVEVNRQAVALYGNEFNRNELTGIT